MKSNIIKNTFLFFGLCLGLFSISYSFTSFGLRFFNQYSFLFALEYSLCFFIFGILAIYISLKLAKKAGKKINRIVYNFLLSFLIIFLAYIMAEFINYQIYKTFLGYIIIGFIFSSSLIILYSLIYSWLGLIFDFSKKYLFVFNFILGILIILCAVFNSHYVINIILLALISHVFIALYFKKPIEQSTQKLILGNYFLSLFIFTPLIIFLKNYYQVLILFFIVELIAVILVKKKSPKYDKYFFVYNIFLLVLGIVVIF